MPAAAARKSGTVTEASAPTRIDLAGGTLDIWPLYLFHSGAVTVNVAIDRRAWCRVETGVAGMRIESKDTGATAEGRDVAEILQGDALSLVAHVLHALGIEAGMRLTVESRVPAGSGLGGSSALAVAVAAAVSQAAGRPLESEALWPIARDAEAQAIGVPTGVQDYHAAIHGGVLGVHLKAGRVEVERLATDSARVAESLLLVDAGAPRFSGINNWEVFKGQIDGEASVRDSLSAIARVARGVREALLAHRYEAVAGLMAEEWEARKRLAPAVTTAEIDRIDGAARSAGGAAKVCGAGGGGMVAVWAPPRGRREVEAAMDAAGFGLVPFRIDPMGVSVR